MALRDQKPRMFSTFWDVLNLAQLIATEKVDVSEQSPELWNVVKFKAQIEEFIIQVDSLILSKLRPWYPLSTLLGPVTSARVSVPVPHRRNSGDSELISVKLNSDTLSEIYTAAWILSFTSSTEYSIYSSLEGGQGAGWKVGDATNTTSNGEITILSSFWLAGSAPFSRGDQFLFSVTRTHPLIQFLSNVMATSLAMTSLFVSESPNTSQFGDSLWKRGMEIIIELQTANAI